MRRLCGVLQTTHRRRWGWKADPGQDFAPWVLYVELPQGQVSFHSLERGEGPDYPSDWDQQYESESRILTYCDSLLAQHRDTLNVGGADYAP